MSKIKSVHARQIIDCKRRPMVEVDIETEDGCLGRGSAPTGSSVGMYESYVLRDNDPAHYQGRTVHRAVDNVNRIIAPALTGLDVEDQRLIDQTMIRLDGTPEKKKLGGNAIYSVSIAALRAAAATKHQEVYEYLSDQVTGCPIQTLPVPSFNIMNGGMNYGVCQAFNEMMINPYRAGNIEEAVEIGCMVFEKLGKVIEKYTHSQPEVGKSFGYACPTEDPEEALKMILEAADQSGFGDKVCLALDCASSEMYNVDQKAYYLNGSMVSGDQQIEYINSLTEKYSFLFVEDMLDENDWAHYEKAHRLIDRTILLGDDLIATNPDRLRKASEIGAVDGFILKPNQVGTISEALDAFDYAKGKDMFAVPSGRAGGVVGDIVMDLAVGLGIPFIKNGAPRSGERIDKLNFLLRASDRYPDAKLSNLDGVVRFS